MDTSKSKIAIRRFLAFGIDWLFMAIWAGIVFGLVMLIFSGQPPRPSGPWSGQAVGFLAMTLPIILYFSICEASAWRATPGKRFLSLRVVGIHADQNSFSRILLRNLIKFLPWELGHLVANQAIYSSAAGVPDWTYIPMFFAFVLPLWWMLSIIILGVSPYDRMTNIRIIVKEKSARAIKKSDASGA
jgi:uncharacterized RDD family membrane protein YckC